MQITLDIDQKEIEEALKLWLKVKGISGVSTITITQNKSSYDYVVTTKAQVKLEEKSGKIHYPTDPVVEKVVTKTGVKVDTGGTATLNLDVT